MYESLGFVGTAEFKGAEGREVMDLKGMKSFFFGFIAIKCFNGVTKRYLVRSGKYLLELGRKVSAKAW